MMLDLRRLQPFVMAAAFSATALMAAPTVASARAARVIDYEYDQVWSAMVRMVRVDLRAAIADRDPDVGFMLFQYRDPVAHTEHTGSAEIFRITERGAPRIRVQLQVDGVSPAVEHMLLSRLQRKLREDYGVRTPMPPITRRGDRPPARRADGAREERRERAERREAPADTEEDDLTDGVIYELDENGNPVPVEEADEEAADPRTGDAPEMSRSMRRTVRRARRRGPSYGR